MNRIYPRFAATIILIGILMALTGCDLFSTRDAEEPDSGRRTWETPRIPADVLSNLASAMVERDAVNYLRSFNADLLAFEADQVALARDPSLAGWDYAAESQHIQRLFSEGTLPADSLLAVIFTSSVENILGDSAEIRASYELTAETALAGVPHQVSGTAEFGMSMGREGYWQIHRWRDIRTEEQNTWSDLKSLVR